MSIHLSLTRSLKCDRFSCLNVLPPPVVESSRPSPWPAPSPIADRRIWLIPADAVAAVGGYERQETVFIAKRNHGRHGAAVTVDLPSLESHLAVDEHPQVGKHGSLGVT